MNESKPDKLVFLLIILLLFCSGCMKNIFHISGQKSVVRIANAEVSGKIQQDTLWSGEIRVTKDIIVQNGVTLFIEPGARILFTESESSRTDPEYYFPDNELIVRGRLVAVGKKGSMIYFTSSSGKNNYPWAGIIFDRSDKDCKIIYTEISGSENGISLIDSSPVIRNNRLIKNKYGLTIMGKSTPEVEGNKITDNEYGIMNYNPGFIVDEKNNHITGNIEDNLFSYSSEREPQITKSTFTRLPGMSSKKIYLKDQSISIDTVWEGTVVIEGTVQVEYGATLVIKPGTEIRFVKKDSDRNGYGGSMILGLGGKIKAEGEYDDWILFTSDEEFPAPGDWYMVSMITSDQDTNSFKFCRFEYGYRGLHSHFSRARAENCEFANNIRAIQFQESDMEISSCLITDNISAMRFRDSQVVLKNNLVSNNTSGINFLRSSVKILGNRIYYNLMDSFVARESEVEAYYNTLDNNRKGAYFKDSNVILDSNRILRNFENGFSFSGSQGEIINNEITDNGRDGISTRSSKVLVKNNTLLNNGRFNIDINDSTSIIADRNYWGTESFDAIYKSINDRDDEPSLGKVEINSPSTLSDTTLINPGFIVKDMIWSGNVVIKGDVTFIPSTTLKILPGTVVKFEEVRHGDRRDLLCLHPNFEGGEIIITGIISAKGLCEKPIVFTLLENAIGNENSDTNRASTETEKNSLTGLTGVERGTKWGSVNLLDAVKAEFEFCRFTMAERAVHFSNSRTTIISSLFEDNNIGVSFRLGKVKLSNNIFRHNNTGIRFHNSRPIIEYNNIVDNKIGIFISRESKGLVFRYNNFIGNTRYNVNLGEEMSSDVDTRNNYWGTIDPEKIQDGFFDQSKSDYLGRVIFQPFESTKLLNKNIFLDSK